MTICSFGKLLLYRDSFFKFIPSIQLKLFKNKFRYNCISALKKGCLQFVEKCASAVTVIFLLPIRLVKYENLKENFMSLDR